MVTKTVQGHNALSRVWEEAVEDDYRYIPEVQDGWRVWRHGWWRDGTADAFLSMSQVAETCWRDKKGKPDRVTGGSTATAAGGLKFAGLRRTKRVDEWDADPHLLGLADGQVMDLGAGKVRNAEPGDYLTRFANAAVPKGLAARLHSPVYDFLEEKFPDPEVREWMGRWCGYCLSGSTKEQLAVWVWGDTATGKSTLRAMLGALLGNYHYGLPNDIFKADAIARGAEKGYALERCPGVRLVSFTEWGTKWQLDESFFTSITGGDTVYGRRVRGVPMNFIPSFKLMAFANYLPAPPLSAQLLRRLVPIPMDVSHEHAPDVDAMGGLTGPEALGAFAQWCLDGYARYRKEGLRPLPSVSQAMLRDLVRGGDDLVDDPEVRALFEEHFVQADKADRHNHRLAAKEVHAAMLRDIPASTREGRAITRWCRAHFEVRKVHGQPFYMGVYRAAG